MVETFIFHFPGLLSSWGSVTKPVAWPCGYINMPLPQLEFAQGITLSAWARLLNPNPRSVIFSLENAAFDRSIALVGVSKDSKTLQVGVPGDQDGRGFIKPAFSGYDPHFAHVGLVWDPENSQARLYLNGTQAAVGVITDEEEELANSVTDMTLVIGRSKDDGQRANSWDGQVGEVRVYNKAFTNADIRFLHDSTGPLGATPTSWNDGRA